MEVDGWKVELMEELVDGSDVFFVVGRAGGCSRICSPHNIAKAWDQQPNLSLTNN